MTNYVNDNRKQRTDTNDDKTDTNNESTMKRPGKALVVEDEPILLEAVRQMFECLGFETVVAHDGKQALENYMDRLEEIDLLITDMIMPNLSGPALAQAFWHKRSDLNVIIMSGYELKSKRKGLLEQGVSLCLQKPFTLLELGDAAIQVLSR